MQGRTTTERSLYERLGGDAFVNLMVNSYFDELAEDGELGRFFENVPMTALKAHQVKFFQVCFGRKSDQASSDDMINYLLVTHTRLFRDMDMDETHFDLIAGCFVRSLESFLVARELIDEAVGLLAPLRTIFERGAQIAREEKAMSDEQLKSLPTTTAENFSCEDVAQKLPECKVDVPEWLPAALDQVKKYSIASVEPKRHAKEDVVRAWTCQLTEAFAGDKEVADTFMDMSFLKHHAYLVAFLSLAFGGEQAEEVVSQLIPSILSPRGPNLPELTRSLFERMIKHFGKLCSRMSLDKNVTVRCLEQLRSCCEFFPDLPTVRVGSTPHAIHPSRKNLSQVLDKTAPDLDSTCHSASSCGSGDSTFSTSTKSSRRQRWQSRKKATSQSSELSASQHTRGSTRNLTSGLSVASSSLKEGKEKIMKKLIPRILTSKKKE